MTKDHGTAHRSPADLVAAATRGNEDAWTELVRRYTPLVQSVIRPYGLSRTDAADVHQTVWLRLVEHVDRLREPAALATWMATTTRRECYRLLRAGRWIQPFDPTDDTGMPGLVDSNDPDENLLRAERHQALRDGFGQLPARCRELLSMLTADPPASYREISEQMRMPVGSVGPTLTRCLHKLRNCPAIVAFVEGLRLEGGEGDRGGVVSMER